MTFLRKLIQPSYKAGYAKSASESAHPNLWDGLVGAWMPSLGATGSTLRDVSGNDNHGTLAGMDAATDWVITSKGLALDFDGANDLVTQADPQGFFARSGSDDLTVSCWLYPKSLSGYQSIIGNRNAHFSFNWIIYQHTSGGTIQLHGSSQYQSTYVPALNEWTHICATVNSNTCRLFANGNLVQGPFAYNYWSASPTQLTFGAYGTPAAYGEPFLGGLSNISIYHRALSSSEIQELYVDSLAPFRQKSIRIFGGVGIPTDTSKIITVKRNKSDVEPSYKSGYAQSAGESAHPNLWDGLVGAWMPSLGVTGDTLRDVSGNRNHGTLTSMDPATDWVTTSRGLALDFDGSDRIVVPHTQKVDVRKQLTISVLCNPTTNKNAWTALAYKNVPAINGSYHIGIDPSNNLQGGVKDGGWRTVQIPTSINAGSWHHVSMSIDENLQQITFYHNGEIVYQSAWTWVMSGNSAPLTISQNGTTEGFIGRTASVSIYDRVLSPSEIKQLYVDPLAPFRKKQQVAFNVYPLTLLEKIRSVAKPTTTRAISVKKNSVPSYKSGYAKSASESAHPNLWDGLVGAWMPSLGVTGGTLRDVSGNRNHGTLTNMDPATDWVVSEKGLVLDFDGVDDEVRAGNVLPASGDFTISTSFSTSAGNSIDACVFGNDVSNSTTWLGCYWATTHGTANNQIRLYVAGAEVLVGSNIINTGVRNVAVTRQGDEYRLYLDGELDASGTRSGTLGSSFKLGSAKFGSFLKPYEGQIGNSFLYSNTLSPSEIKQLYVDPLAPFRKKTTIGYQPSKELRGLFRT